MTKLSDQFPIERTHSSARLHSAACSHGLVSQLVTVRSAALKDFLSSGGDDAISNYGPSISTHRLLMPAANTIQWCVEIPA
ncbi:hypothetical protein [Paraburkholderia phenoliruptrix]|uniref:hypothetical protein n=1 Tax=Paraburkholderia phenoliruptrix TaxID=252970 RepID=UPI002869AB95|nr:hypothetical protein [Paraburkholderia phenoliruptrix]WMY08271.1 hypothetical protein P3F88_00375 [Paraburkholderia phenoliruptrix]